MVTTEEKMVAWNCDNAEEKLIWVMDYLYEHNYHGLNEILAKLVDWGENDEQRLED